MSRSALLPKNRLATPFQFIIAQWMRTAIIWQSCNKWAYPARDGSWSWQSFGDLSRKLMSCLERGFDNRPTVKRNIPMVRLAKALILCWCKHSRSCFIWRIVMRSSSSLWRSLRGYQMRRTETTSITLLLKAQQESHDTTLQKLNGSSIGQFWGPMTIHANGCARTMHKKGIGSHYNGQGPHTSYCWCTWCCHRTVCE